MATIVVNASRTVIVQVWRIVIPFRVIGPMNVNCKVHHSIGFGNCMANRFSNFSDYTTLFSILLPVLMGLTLLGCITTCLIMMWYIAFKIVDSQDNNGIFFCFSQAKYFRLIIIRRTSCCSASWPHPHHFLIINFNICRSYDEQCYKLQVWPILLTRKAHLSFAFF